MSERRRRRIEDDDPISKFTPVIIKTEISDSLDKENIQPAKKKLKLNVGSALGEPLLFLSPHKGINFKIASIPKVASSVRRSLGESFAKLTRSQRARTRKRVNNAIPTMEARIDNKKTAALIEKQKEIESLFVFLMEKFNMKEQNLVLPKETFREILDQNANLMPTLTQFELLNMLKTNDFVTTQNDVEQFHFSRQKIWKFMENRQYQLSSKASNFNNNVQKNFVPKRETDLNCLVKLLLDTKLLTDSNATVKKQKVRNLFHRKQELMPSLKMSELGRCLYMFGFLEEKKDPPGTFTFVQGKIFKLQLEQIAERLYNIEKKVIKLAIGGTADDSDDEDEKEDPLYLDHNTTLKRTMSGTFTPKKLTCSVCREHFLFESTLEVHNKDNHGLSFTIPRALKQFCSDTSLLKITMPSKTNKNLKGEPEKMFVIRNTHSSTVKVSKILHYHSNNYQVVEVTSKGDFKPTDLGIGETFDFIINHDFVSLTGEWHSILLFLEDDLKYEYIEHFYVKDSRVFTPKRDPVHPLPMSSFVPSNEIIKLFNCAFECIPEMSLKEVAIMLDVKSLLAKDPKTRMTEENYTHLLSYAIQIADCAEEKQTREFDMKDQEIKEKKRRFGIELNEQNKIPPDLTNKDTLLLTKVGSKNEVEARIEKIRKDFLYIQVKGKPGWLKDANKVNVKFNQNRIPIRMESKALAIVEDENLSRFMFPNMVPDTLIEITNFDWFNEKVQSNPEQVQAVTHIVNGTSHPAPYIIFGPPGTGKTSTITETICQLWKVLPTARILVTAQSNSACNEVGERLLRYLPKKDVYRLFARSFEEKIKGIDEKLLKASNLETRRHQYPEWSAFYNYRVIICTLCTSGMLHLAGIDTQHFTHVFIDECGSSTEPSSLIPIAGIITSKDRINGHIILAGDIKQLGPIVKSRMATNLGYAKPLMERLMEMPVYEKDPKTKMYNPRMITKLVYNFRSHAKIIEFSNKTFYDGDLLVKGLPESTDWALNWCHLPNKQFPIIFHPSYIESCQEKANPSLFNVKEIDIIEKYVNIMLTFGINRRPVHQYDIGIISPYKRQCQKMSMRFGDNNWSDIEIGTVETFQGREKSIIFISTVRSGSRHVGFLNNPRRLNVSITRAKALMIIVGNPRTLRNDCNWYDLLKFCQTNGGCVSPIRIGLRPSISSDSTSVLSDMTMEFNQLDVKTNNQKVDAKDFL